MKRAREEGPAPTAAVATLGKQAAGAALDLGDDEEVRFELPRTRLFLKAHDAGEGTAFVTTQ